MNKSFFKESGRRGGQLRARGLSPLERSSIASLAAQARWKKTVLPMSSIRLEGIWWEDPVYLEEVLSEGALPAWKVLYRKIADHPFGPTADALQKVLSYSQIYGVTPLWKGILKKVQGT